MSAKIATALGAAEGGLHDRFPYKQKAGSIAKFTALAIEAPAAVLQLANTLLAGSLIQSTFLVLKQEFLDELDDAAIYRTVDGSGLKVLKCARFRRD